MFASLTRARAAGHRQGARILIAAAALAMAGCATADQGFSGLTGSLPAAGYQANHPIYVQEGTEVLDIAVGLGAGGLSQADWNRVVAFAGGARDHATSYFLILAPSGAANDDTAAALAMQARQAALSAGLSAHLIQLASYAVADPDAAAPIRLIYSRIKAMTAPCGVWATDIFPGAGGEPVHSEFGCATQANLAAMIVDPMDLIAPSAPSSGGL